MSGDPDQEYFSDGITEDIITELSRYRPLAVVSRHSSSCFKGMTVDIKEAGKKLGADYLVEGSVRKVGGSVRVTAQLLEAATASHVWAERYDRVVQDVFSVQDELVRRLVSAITGHVEKHTDSRAQAKPTKSLDAYDLWLRAMHGSDLWTLDGNTACQRLLEEAIRKDPMFARAHASLAFCHMRTAAEVARLSRIFQCSKKRRCAAPNKPSGSINPRRVPTTRWAGATCMFVSSNAPARGS